MRRRHVQVVVLEEHARGRRPCALRFWKMRLQRLLGLVVLRVRLAGDDQLDRRRPVVEQVPAALGEAHQQIEPLVGRDAAREADGERRWGRRRAPRPRRTRAARRATAGRAPSARAPGRRARGAARSAPPTARRRESRRSRCPQRRSIRRVRASRGRGGDRAARCIGAAIQVGVCTPLVTCVIGTSLDAPARATAAATCARATSPWRCETPLAARLVRSASGVMLTGSCSSPGLTRPSRRTHRARCRARRRSRRAPARSRRRCTPRCRPAPACGW